MTFLAHSVANIIRLAIQAQEQGDDFADFSSGSASGSTLIKVALEATNAAIRELSTAKSDPHAIERRRFLLAVLGALEATRNPLAPRSRDVSLALETLIASVQPPHTATEHAPPSSQAA